MIFLPDRSYHDLEQPSQTKRKDFSHPYLCGFGHSRLHRTNSDEEHIIDYHEEDEEDYGDDEEQKINNIDLDLYQHPSKRINPRMRYRPAFDVYS